MQLRDAVRRIAKWIGIAVLLVEPSSGCEPPAYGPRPAPPPETHVVVAAALDAPAHVRHHMRWHLDDVRAIERDLLAGSLDDARALAHLIATPEPALAGWAAERDALAHAATDVATAGDVEAGLRATAALATACGDCHRRMARPPALAPSPALPPVVPGASAAMARHRWGVERLIEGLAGPDDERWRAGLAAIATTPAAGWPAGPAETSAPVATLAAELAHTRDRDARTRAYGELLVACRGCHRALAAP